MPAPNPNNTEAYRLLYESQTRLTSDTRGLNEAVSLLLQKAAGKKENVELTPRDVEVALLNFLRDKETIASEASAELPNTISDDVDEKAAQLEGSDPKAVKARRLLAEILSAEPDATRGNIFIVRDLAPSPLDFVDNAGATIRRIASNNGLKVATELSETTIPDLVAILYGKEQANLVRALAKIKSETTKLALSRPEVVNNLVLGSVFGRNIESLAFTDASPLIKQAADAGIPAFRGIEKLPEQDRTKVLEQIDRAAYQRRLAFLNRPGVKALSQLLEQEDSLASVAVSVGEVTEYDRRNRLTEGTKTELPRLDATQAYFSAIMGDPEGRELLIHAISAENNILAEQTVLEVDKGNNEFDIVIVGGGLHTSILVSELAAVRPDLSILVISKDEVGEPWLSRGYLTANNSSKPEDYMFGLPGGANNLMQISLFGNPSLPQVSTSRYPNGRVVGAVTQFAISSGATHLLQGQEAIKFREKDDGTIEVDVLDENTGVTRTVVGKQKVIQATGIGEPRIPFNDVASKKIVEREREKAKNGKRPSVATTTDLEKLYAKNVNRTFPLEDLFEPVKDKETGKLRRRRVLLVGEGDSTLVWMAALGQIENTNNIGQQVMQYGGVEGALAGFKSLTAKEYSEKTRGIYAKNCVLLPSPNRKEVSFKPDPRKIAKIEDAPEGEGIIVYYQNDDGTVEASQEPFDLVVLNTGFEKGNVNGLYSEINIGKVKLNQVTLRRSARPNLGEELATYFYRNNDFDQLASRETFDNGVDVRFNDSDLAKLEISRRFVLEDPISLERVNNLKVTGIKQDDKYEVVLGRDLVTQSIFLNPVEIAAFLDDESDLIDSIEFKTRKINLFQSSEAENVEERLPRARQITTDNQELLVQVGTLFNFRKNLFARPKIADISNLDSLEIIEMDKDNSYRIAVTVNGTGERITTSITKDELIDFINEDFTLVRLSFIQISAQPQTKFEPYVVNGRTVADGKGKFLRVGLASDAGVTTPGNEDLAKLVNTLGIPENVVSAWARGLQTRVAGFGIAAEAENVDREVATREVNRVGLYLSRADKRQSFDIVFLGTDLEKATPEAGVDSLIKARLGLAAAVNKYRYIDIEAKATKSAEPEPPFTVKITINPTELPELAARDKVEVRKGKSELQNRFFAGDYDITTEADVDLAGIRPLLKDIQQDKSILLPIVSTLKKPNDKVEITLELDTELNNIPPSRIQIRKRNDIVEQRVKKGLI